MNAFLRNVLIVAATLTICIDGVAVETPLTKGSDTEGGAWWSFQPLQRPRLPDLPSRRAAWCRTPIDRFIAAKHREIGALPAAEANRRTLIRRLYFDLIGLPPDPEAVDRFVTDAGPDSYEELVDRLLASPRYGERWARHWLDVVHYGETHGYDKDKLRSNAWPYRDYVIRSFNNDKPYGRFVQEQIAGDVLYPFTSDGVEALGFIAAGPWDFIGHAEVAEAKIDGKIARHLDRDDMVQNTIMTFMSLTVGCAQCHEHKFDPISQADYYCLQAVFAALDRADMSYDDDPEIMQRRSLLLERKQELVANQRPLDAQIERLGGTELAKLNEAIAAAKKNKTDVASLKADRAALLARVVDGETRDAKAQTVEHLAEVTGQLDELPSPKYVYAGTVHHGTGKFQGTGATGGQPRTIRLLARGDVNNPGREVSPGAIASLDFSPPRFDLPPNAPEASRRAELARWLTHRENPLTWRSIVNRIWLYHFGRGIVDTPGDFGQMGQLPTHPELLDWLAVEFRDGGGSLKDLHRLIVTSAVYRQSSYLADCKKAIDRDDLPTTDAENRYLWRMNRRHLEAEAIRDAILSVSGALNLEMGGPSFRDFVIEKPEHSPHYEYRLHNAEDPACHRRSVYRFVVRSQKQPFLTVLDCADPSMMVGKRTQTITPLQALATLNNKLVLVMAVRFAARVDAVERKLPEKIDAAYRLALSRPPDNEELAALNAYAQKHGLANTCRVILNLSEFVFVD